VSQHPPAPWKQWIGVISMSFFWTFSMRPSSIGVIHVMKKVHALGVVVENL
jgi:hypothetical protein